MANTQLSDTIHVLAYISYFSGQKITSQEMASSIQTSASLVRKIMASLKQTGLLKQGHGTTNLALARDAAEITVRDIYRSLPQQELFHVDQKTSSTCPVGAAIPPVLDHYYMEIQAAAEAKMARISLQDIMNDIDLQAQLTEKL
ncbi:Rrf2 transcriptional regulator group III [Furfurilactobacillus rossiae]|uniref:Rrf2 family transcriptional regulator n=1 Tax=Furfurilactobacillus rossiae TaxID=231049 RepID=UPI0015B84D90|nr:Rrf2 family transcriptional regulator [Furfurilactobacillus rossiae]MCF6166671.1 Rrf2 family transcriptional regulator [Furfurilactobacillus rossiae]QLE63320.1 Rrf2 transcriptional regulator group III [Furfurilactobacillus rossiae]